MSSTGTAVTYYPSYGGSTEPQPAAAFHQTSNPTGASGGPSSKLSTAAAIINSLNCAVIDSISSDRSGVVSTVDNCYQQSRWW